MGGTHFWAIVCNTLSVLPVSSCSEPFSGSVAIRSATTFVHPSPCSAPSCRRAHILSCTKQHMASQSSRQASSRACGQHLHLIHLILADREERHQHPGLHRGVEDFEVLTNVCHRLSAHRRRQLHGNNEEGLWRGSERLRVPIYHPHLVAGPWLGQLLCDRQRHRRG